MTPVPMNTALGTDTGHRSTDTDRRSANTDRRSTDAKAARKRAKEKARSMHAQIFRKRDDSKPRTSSSSTRMNNVTSHTTPGRAPRTGKSPKSFSSNTILGLGPLVFHDSGNHSSASSITFFSNSHASSSSSSSSSSLSLLSATNHVTITQGPSFFEANEQNQRNLSLPRMPKRCNDYDQMNRSLSLEDIALTDYSHGDARIAGRPWSEEANPPSTTLGIVKPCRMASQSAICTAGCSTSHKLSNNDSSTSICFSETSSVVSFANSMSEASLVQDRWAACNPRHAV